MDTVHDAMMRMTKAGRSLLADDRLEAGRVLTSEQEMPASATDTSASSSSAYLIGRLLMQPVRRIYERPLM